MKSFFLLSILGILCTMCSQPTPVTDKTQEPETFSVYIGTYTGESSEGIYKSEFNPVTGSLSQAELLVKTENPSFLQVADQGSVLFAVNENDPGTLSLFTTGPENGYSLAQSLSTEGIHPCHIALNSQKSLISVANYSSGNISVFDLAEGRVTLKETFQHRGKGPDQERQEGPHAHFSTFSPNEQLIYAIDLGIDQVLGYPLADSEGGFVAWRAEPGDGPRHLDFHPNGQLVFVLNELSNTVQSFTIDSTGAFVSVDRKSTLPEGFTGSSKAADIHISADGRFLYTSNRGYDSIAIFEVSANGGLTLRGFAEEGINNPRNFTISPDGKHMIIANQSGNDIVVYAISPDGMLQKTAHRIEVGNPVCVKFG